tara:strand:+ start:684 stop:908 length:225 start_codon:yes stop_codon:yes gene_type:complete
MFSKKKGYNINGDFFLCNLQEPFLDKLLVKFLNNNININVAVAVNSVLIQRSEWKKKKICFNDKIEVVRPFNGG